MLLGVYKLLEVFIVVGVVGFEGIEGGYIGFTTKVLLLSTS